MRLLTVNFINIMLFPDFKQKKLYFELLYFVIFIVNGLQNFMCRVHVRRTDKINLEAAFHSIEEYMYWVEHYYDRLERTGEIDQRRVFLASDDPTVLPNAQQK